jgi:hypothetical protein
VEDDEKVYLEWLEKAANRNNPRAMDRLGDWFRRKDECKKALTYYLAAADLRWKESMFWLGHMLEYGEGCVKDLGQAAIWYAKGGHYDFSSLLGEARIAFQNGTTEDLDCDFNQLCYSLGWGLYWYMYGAKGWKKQSDEEKMFGNHRLDYYCENVELQQKSIFTFLLCWKKMVGVKDLGLMIAKTVWEGKGVNLVKKFEKVD